MKPELFSTPLGAATLGAEFGAIIATTVAAYQGNFPAELFDAAVAVSVCVSNRELRGELLYTGKLVINLFKPKIKS
jgi:hypothetical protein